MENLLFFLIVLIFILRGIAKLIQRAKPQAMPSPEEALPQEVKEYFESIGPPPEEEAKKITLRAIPEEKKIIKPPMEIKKEEPEFPRAPIKEKSPFFPLIISAESIKQGIILLTILGPPKAKQFPR